MQSSGEKESRVRESRAPCPCSSGFGQRSRAAINGFLVPSQGRLLVGYELILSIRTSRFEWPIPGRNAGPNPSRPTEFESRYEQQFDGPLTPADALKLAFLSARAVITFLASPRETVALGDTFIPYDIALT